jgi:hypothetical protein
VALKLAAGHGVAFGFELALDLAAPVQEPIGSSFSLGQLPLGILARPTKVDDLAHPALDDASGVMQVPCGGFGAKYAHSVAAGARGKSASTACKKAAPVCISAIAILRTCVGK